MEKYRNLKFALNEAQINGEIEKILAEPLSAAERTGILKQLLNSIDNTTLEGLDTAERVKGLCDKSKKFCNENLKPVAAVCVYPVFVKMVKEQLAGTGIRTASVAGAFPAGQCPIDIKISEIQYAISEGADEIDMVISRGSFLEGNYRKVYDEIAAIRETCKNVHLKVILETGELQTPDNIYVASKMAIDAGADFIKTSTGKVAVNATPQAAYVMLTAIAENLKETGKMVGFKAAGGLSTIDQAVVYARLFKKIAGEKYFTNEYFRLGTSRLTEKLYNEIMGI